MDGKKIFIGRNPQCDYVIDQRYESVSGDHCSLTEEINERTGAVVCYRLDEHSTNGTHINAQLIHHSTFYVHQGDHITLGAQYVLEWDKINACFAAQSKKTMSRPYVPPTPPDPRATQRRPAPIPNQWGGDNAATVRNATDAAHNATQMVNTGETVITNNPNTIPPAKKKRNGGITFLLWLAIIFNIINPILNGTSFYDSLTIFEEAGYSQAAGWVSVFIISAVFFSILNIVGFAQLLLWKKAGFYVFCVSSIVSAAANILIGMQLSDACEELLYSGNPFDSTYNITILASAIISVLVWRGLLAIRKDGKSCWSQLS